jgi:hypothetical protein
VTHDISRRWQLFAIVLVIGFFVWLLAPVLMPFAVAGMLAYLGDPLRWQACWPTSATRWPTGWNAWA